MLYKQIKQRSCQRPGEFQYFHRGDSRFVMHLQLHHWLCAKVNDVTASKLWNCCKLCRIINTRLALYLVFVSFAYLFQNRNLVCMFVIFFFFSCMVLLHSTGIQMSLGVFIARFLARNAYSQFCWVLILTQFL